MKFKASENNFENLFKCQKFFLIKIQKALSTHAQFEGPKPTK